MTGAAATGRDRELFESAAKEVRKSNGEEGRYLFNTIITTYPDYYRYFSEKDFTWNKIHQLNRNPLLTMNLGADGLKTGDTAESGFGLVGSAVQNGQRLILVINGMKTATDRSEEARKLLNWGFRSFDVRTLFEAGDVVGAASVFGGARGEVSLVAEAPIKIFVTRGSSEKLAAKIVYKGPLPAPIAQGEELAHLKVWRGASEVLDVPLKTAEAVGTGTLSQRALDAGMEMASGLIRKTFAKN